MCFYLLGYLFDKQKYSKTLTILQLPEFPKMYGNKYRFNAEIQEMTCWEGKITVRKYNKKFLVFSKN